VSIRDEIIGRLEGEEIIFYDPPEIFDACIVGIAQRSHDFFVLYDYDAVIDALTLDGIQSGTDASEAREEAMDHFGFNVVGGWYGRATPAFVTRVKVDE